MQELAFILHKSNRDSLISRTSDNKVLRGNNLADDIQLAFLCKIGT